MAARILVVHDDTNFQARAVEGLRAAGHDVLSNDDPMTALTALDCCRNLSLLITRVAFPKPNPNGVSLALSVKDRFRTRGSDRSEVRVLFVGRPKFHGYAEDVGNFVGPSVSVPDLVAAASRMLASPP
jgi:hypothetical protein